MVSRQNPLDSTVEVVVVSDQRCFSLLVSETQVYNLSYIVLVKHHLVCILLESGNGGSMSDEFFKGIAGLLNYWRLNGIGFSRKVLR